MYGVPMSKDWCKTTLAHNTMVVDERNQSEATGTCLEFLTESGYSAALLDAGAAIEHGKFRRAAFLLGEDVVVFIDLIHIDGGGKHVLDLAYHPQGKWAEVPAGAAFAPLAKPGYSYLQGMMQTDSDGSSFEVEGPIGKTSIVFAESGKPARFLVGTGPGADTNQRVPIVIARREANDAAYAWAVTTRGGAPRPTLTMETIEQHGKAVLESDAAVVRVTMGGKSWMLVANPQGLSLSYGGHDSVDRKLAVEAN